MKNYSVRYQLSNDAETITFNSEKEACAYLGVAKCSVASCYRSGSRCKGYTVKRLGLATHGEYKTRLFKIWEGMHERCERPKHTYYKDYGGRGIKVCEEWREYIPFANWARSNGYTESLSIDRIDVNGDYTPANCRWVTEKEQHNNTRRNHFVEYGGKVYTISQLADETGIKYTTLKERIKAGWSVDDAVNTPVRLRTCGYRPSGADMRETKNGCDDCFIPMFYNLEDDDSICRDCGVGE